MPEPIISVEHLAKSYTLSHRPSYGTLRDSLTEFVTKSFRRSQKKAQREEFFALRDLSFDVQPGQRVGIIGRNGAGKSTLLKILSQITPPTAGKVTLRGRVASLLEVGTGFHPELTGRENVFLNGAILGMKQAEIKKKFDEIVAFAEIEKFLDTPVKRYSSGMYVRLAFAVAAHLDPEILIVDEVLAVGDAQFQKKCISKMQDVAGTGRTVLFVSHNMAAISQLCERVILLKDGLLVVDGAPETIINDYFAAANNAASHVDLSSDTLRRNSLPDSAVQWRALSIKNGEGNLVDHLAFREPFSVNLEVVVHRPVNDLRLGFAIQSSLGFPVFNTFQFDSGLPTSLQPGTYSFRANFEENLLSPGLYDISLGANGPSVTDWIPSAIQFTVSSIGTTPNISWDSHKGGIIVHPVHWTLTSTLS